MKKWNMASLALIIYIILTFNLQLLTCNCFAQPTQEWVRRWDSQYHMGDQPSKMTLDRFGNIIVTGAIGTTSQGNDIATVKYSPGGTQQWAVTYNQISNTNDLASSIAADSSGNVFITGYTGYNLGPFDIVTIKYNNSGVQQWAKIYHGTAGNTDSYPSDIAVDRAGYIYVCGQTGYDYGGFGNAFLIKYNSNNGDSIWVRRYSVFPGYFSSFRSMAIDRFNNIYTTGFYSTLNSWHGLTVKYDSNGTLQWPMQYISNSNNNDVLVKLALDTSGSAYVTGATYTGSPSIYLTIKYSSSGAQQWVRNYSYLGYDEGRSIITDKSGNAYVTGNSYRGGSIDDIATIKYNQNGDSLWVRRYMGPDNNGGAPRALTIDDSANIYITGNTNSGITTLKYSTSGIQRWVAFYPGQSVDNAVDGLRNIYVCGNNNLGGTGFDYITIKYSQPVGVKPISNLIPNEFKLEQNYPNPFNSNSKIKMQISKLGEVKLIIYDILGREIKTLVNQELKPGTYVVNFDGTNYPSGVYFYKLISDGNIIDTKKLILLK